MAKKITKAQIARAKSQPTTGNGTTGGQKPKMSETNLPGRHGQSWVARLLTRASKPGKHSAN